MSRQREAVLEETEGRLGWKNSRDQDPYSGVNGIYEVFGFGAVVELNWNVR